MEFEKYVQAHNCQTKIAQLTRLTEDVKKAMANNSYDDVSFKAIVQAFNNTRGQELVDIVLKAIEDEIVEQTEKFKGV